MGPLPDMTLTLVPSASSVRMILLRTLLRDDLNSTVMIREIKVDFIFNSYK